jgi:hypothetical protein
MVEKFGFGWVLRVNGNGKGYYDNIVVFFLDVEG